MNFIQHNINGVSLAVLASDGLILRTPQQFLQMMMDSGAEGVILPKEQVDERFFDLQSGLAGEMLQKVVNYRLRLGIVGDFSGYTSKSVRSFIYESNRSNAIVFVSTVDEALRRLSA